MMRLQSLRWRVATFYALLLVGTIAAVAVVLTVQLSQILFEAAQARIDSVGADIDAQIGRNGLVGTFGEGLQIDQAFALPGNLDHWASPTTFVEIDTPAGYQLGKSTNMGSASFLPGPFPRPGPLFYRDEQARGLGHVLVRDELLQYPGVSLNIKVGESMAIFDATLARTRTLLALAVLLAAILVAVGSYALATRV